MASNNIINLTDNEFYNYIGSSENKDSKNVLKNLKRFFLVIHPDKCEIDKLKTTFSENPTIMDFIDTNESNKSFVCETLFVSFQNKYNELYKTESEFPSLDPENADLFYDFANSSEALLTSDIINQIALLSAFALNNFFIDNPDIILTEEDTNEILQKCRDFNTKIKPFSDKLFTINDSGSVIINPEQIIDQKGGSPKTILIILITLFIVSFITSVQCSMHSSKFTYSTQTSQTEKKTDSKVVKDSNSFVQALIPVGRAFHKSVGVIEEKIAEISGAISQTTVSSFYKVIGNFISKIDEKNADSLITIKSEKMKIETNTFDLKRLQEENARKKLDKEKSNLMIELSKNIVLSHEKIKLKNFEYLQGTFFRVLIDNLVGEKKEGLNTEFIESLNELVGYHPTLGTNFNQNVINTIGQIMASYYSEVCSNILCPKIETPKDFYENYLLDFIEFGHSTVIEIKQILNQILGEEGVKFIGELQESYTDKNTLSTYGRTGLESFSEVELNNFLQKKIKTLLTQKSGKLGAVLGAAFSVNEIFEKYGHYIYLILNVLDLSDSGFQTLTNLRKSTDIVFESMELIKPDKRNNAQVNKILTSAGITGVVSYFSEIITISQSKFLPTTVVEINTNFRSSILNFLGLQKQLSNEELLSQNKLYKSLIDNKYIELDINGNCDFLQVIDGIQKFSEANVIDTYKTDLNQLLIIIQDESKNISVPSGSIYQAVKGNISELITLNTQMITSTNDLIKVGFDISSKKMIEGPNIVLQIGQNILGELVVALGETTSKNLSKIMPNIKNMGIVFLKTIKEETITGDLLTYGGSKKLKKYTKRKNKYNKTKKLYKKKKLIKKNTKKIKKKSKKI
jgi:hypothetical protein